MDDPIDLRVSTIGRVHPNNEVLTYYFIQHRNNWFRIWMSIIVYCAVRALFPRVIANAFRHRILAISLPGHAGFLVSGDRKRDALDEIKNWNQKILVLVWLCQCVRVQLRLLNCLEKGKRCNWCWLTFLFLPKVSISWCLDESRQGTRLTFWKYLSKFSNYLLCVLIFPANEYMKDHICELRRNDMNWRDSNSWSLRYRCSALPTIVSYQAM